MSLKLATQYALRLQDCKDNDTLALICAELSIDLEDNPSLVEWRAWLATIFDTAWHTINDPDLEEIIK